jgi:hypothetical protein
MTMQPNTPEQRYSTDDFTSGRRTEFETVLERGRRTEWRLFWGELIVLTCLLGLGFWTLGLGF